MAKKPDWRSPFPCVTCKRPLTWEDDDWSLIDEDTGDAECDECWQKRFAIAFPFPPPPDGGHA